MWAHRVAGRQAAVACADVGAVDEVEVSDRAQEGRIRLRANQNANADKSEPRRLIRGP